MNTPNRRFRAVDILLLVLTALPILAGMTIKILTTPPSEGIEISGAKIFFTLKMPFWGNLPITESQTNSFFVILSLMFLCLYMTHGLRANVKTTRAVIAEWIVNAVESLVKDNMGEYFKGFAPFIAAMLALSGFSSLLALVGLFPPTSDINVVSGWAVLVFVLITYYKTKCGIGHYVKELCSPIALAPLNIIGEVATPISMAFRHYGNILSGVVISILVATGLQGLSNMLLGWLPGFLGEFPFLQIGLPAILSVYFDVFSSLLQAFIFAMLTMLYVGGAFSIDDYREMKKRKMSKNKTVSVKN